MANSPTPYIPADRHLPEMTLKVVVLAIILAAVLALSNAYLALKIGILTSASIPAAVLSMGIFRFFRSANILENNLVQTAASAGEAVAGGIVYTVPALVIIGYWHGFAYWENFAIALLGGLLGVMFSIPLRRILMTDPNLAFPEGRAIAAILQTQATNVRAFRDMMMGGLIGAGLELSQIGFKILASSWEVWFVARRAIFGFGGGFSAAMIGAGYLIGFRMGLSIFCGAVVGWLISVPIVGRYYHVLAHAGDHTAIVMQLWDQKIRYIGIGAMLFAGVWTLITLTKPLIHSVRTTMRSTSFGHALDYGAARTERDIPLLWVVLSVIVLTLLLGALFYVLLPIDQLQLHGSWPWVVLFWSVSTTLVLSIVFAALTAYFSGMVGVAATPGSAFVIGGLLLCAVALLALIHHQFPGELSASQVLASRAIIIMMVSITTGAASISLDNIQDLKVGHLVGATPWKQQLMLILGVVVAAAVIPPIMQLLFNVYGIAGVFPRAGMDSAQSLAAPPAAVMAALSQAVFQHDLPLGMLGIGVALMMAIIALNVFLKRIGLGLSALGFAIGIYLPLASSIPLFLGGLFAWLSDRGQRDPVKAEHKRGVIIACGLVAGAALIDVALAVPFSIMHSPDALRVVPAWWGHYAILFSVVATVLLGYGFMKVDRVV